MLDRKSLGKCWCHALLTVVVTLAITTPASATGPSRPGANGPLRLIAPAEPAPAEPAPAEPAPAETTVTPPIAPTPGPVAAVAAEEMADTSPAGALTDVPAASASLPMPGTSDDVPLGQPNGMLSARPASPQTVSTEAWWTRFDPRQSELMRVIGGMTVVLGLLLGCRLLAKRSGRMGAARRPAGVLDVLARYPIARGQSLALIRVARRVILVHQSQTGMRTLSEIVDRDEVASLMARIESGSRRADSTKFRAMLESFHEDHARMSTDVEVVDLTRPRVRAATRRLPA